MLCNTKVSLGALFSALVNAPMPQMAMGSRIESSTPFSRITSGDILERLDLVLLDLDGAFQSLHVECC